MYFFDIGILHVVLLTHVDSLELISKGDLIDIYNCELVKLKVMSEHSLRNVFDVHNCQPYKEQ